MSVGTRRTWAIGDLQGCAATFEALLARLALGAGDRVWLVGDLVNRGTGSLAILRRVLGEPERFVAVLGNHDLHLLSMAAGLRKRSRRDTAQTVLDTAEGAALVEGVARLPLVHRELLDVDGVGPREHVLVHAGLPPGWSPSMAEAAGGMLSAALQGRAGASRADVLRRLRGRGEATPMDGEALAVAAAGLTRMRGVRRSAGGGWWLDHRHAGPPHALPQPWRPWFEVFEAHAAAGQGGPRVVHGHWAALGLRATADVLSLDTGAVWGRGLTAVCLEDGRSHFEPTHPVDLPGGRAATEES